MCKKNITFFLLFVSSSVFSIENDSAKVAADRYAYLINQVYCAQLAKMLGDKVLHQGHLVEAFSSNGQISLEKEEAFYHMGYIDGIVHTQQPKEELRLSLVDEKYEAICSSKELSK